jgi:hypothetical protein
VMNDFAIRGELANDHDYARMSQTIIRLIHAAPPPPPPPQAEREEELRVKGAQ